MFKATSSKFKVFISLILIFTLLLSMTQVTFINGKWGIEIGSTKVNADSVWEDVAQYSGTILPAWSYNGSRIFQFETIGTKTYLSRYTPTPSGQFNEINNNGTLISTVEIDVTAYVYRAEIRSKHSAHKVVYSDSRVNYQNPMGVVYGTYSNVGDTFGIQANPVQPDGAGNKISYVSIKADNSNPGSEGYTQVVIQRKPAKPYYYDKYTTKLIYVDTGIGWTLFEGGSCLPGSAFGGYKSFTVNPVTGGFVRGEPCVDFYETVQYDIPDPSYIHMYQKTDGGYKYTRYGKPWTVNGQVAAKDALVTTNIIALEGSYPDNGKHIDGYWYVKKTSVYTAPTIVINAPTNGVEYGLNLLLQGNVTDIDVGDIVTVKYNIDGGPPSSVTPSITSTGVKKDFSSTVVDTSMLSVGAHTLNVWAEDNRGEKSETTSISFIKYKVDTWDRYSSTQVSTDSSAWVSQGTLDLPLSNIECADYSFSPTLNNYTPNASNRYVLKTRPDLYFYYNPSGDKTKLMRIKYVSSVNETTGRFDVWRKDASTNSKVYVKGTISQSGLSGKAGTYPNNAKHTDGYWYVNTTIANSAPTIGITSPVPGFTYKTDFYIKGTVKDLDVGDVLTVKYSIDGGTVYDIEQIISDGTQKSFRDININLAPLMAGSHTLRVWVNDNKGGSSTTTIINFTKPALYLWYKYANKVVTTYTPGSIQETFNNSAPQSPRTTQVGYSGYTWDKYKKEFILTGYGATLQTHDSIWTELSDPLFNSAYGYKVYGGNEYVYATVKAFSITTGSEEVRGDHLETLVDDISAYIPNIKNPDGYWYTLGAQANDNPTIVVSTTAGGVYSDKFGYNTISLKGSVSDSNVGDTLTVYYKIDEGATNPVVGTVITTGNFNTTSIDVSSLSEGNHTLSVWCKDQTNKLSNTVILPFSIDKTPPSINLMGLEHNKMYIDTEINANLVFSDASLPLYKAITFAKRNSDGSYTDIGDESSINGKTISQSGVYRINIAVFDAVGNSKMQTVDFKLNKSPVLSELALNKEFYSSKEGYNTLQISGNVCDLDIGDILKLSYKIDNGAETAIKTVTSIGSKQGINTLFDVANLSEGIHYIDIIATNDILGDIITVSQQLSFTMDKTNPTISILGVANGEVYQGHVTPNININDSLSGIEVYSTLLDEKPYTSGLIITEGGSHKLTAYARDKAGNVQEVSVEFYINYAPILALNTDNAGVFSSNTGYNILTLDGWIKDFIADEILKVYYKIDSGSTVDSGFSLVSDGEEHDLTSVKIDVGGLTEGAHSITVWAEDDKGGVSAELGLSLSIDKTAPVIAVDNPYYNWSNKDIQVSLLASDTGSGIETKLIRLSEQTDKPNEWTTCTGIITISGEGETYLHYEVTDKVGNKAEGYFGSYKLDKTLPYVLNQNREYDVWLNRDITTTISSIDTGSGLDQEKFLVTGSDEVPDINLYEDYAHESEIELKTEGIHYIHYFVSDIAGNSQLLTFGSYRIDKSSPVITINNEDYDWKNEDIILNIDINDFVSGINIKKYAVTNSSNVPDTWEDLVSNELTIDKDGEWYVHVYAEDFAGNSEQRVYGPYKLDKTAPTIYTTNANYEWEKTDITINIIYEDDCSGIDYFTYAVSQSLTEANTWNTYDGAIQIQEEGVWYVHYSIKDRAGNTSKGVFGPYKLDNTADEVVPTNTNYEWTKENLELGLIVNQGTSGVKTIEYAITQSASSPTIWNLYSGTPETVTEDGVYYLHYRVTDNAWNITEGYFGTYKKDSVPCTIATDNINYTWSNQTQYVRLFANDSASGIKLYEYSITNREDSPIVWTSYSDGEPISINSEGEWFVHYRLEDFAGNRCEGSFGTYKIDNTLPDPVCSNTDYSWKNEDIRIDLTGSDNLSGVKFVKYNVSETVNTSKLQIVDGEIYITDSGEFYINYVLEDYAGNERTGYFGPYKLDKVVPICYINEAINKWENSYKTLDIIYQDSTSGIKTKEYALSDSEHETELDWNSYTDPIILTNESIKYIKFKTEDNAGNISTGTLGWVGIDVKTPNIVFDKYAQEEWTSESVTINVSIDDSQSGVSEQKYKVTSSTMMPDTFDEELTDKIILNKTGSKYVHYKITDKVGNTTAGSVGVFNIDKDAPIVMVDNQNVTPTQGSIEVNLDFIDEDSGLSVRKYKLTTSSSSIALEDMEYYTETIKITTDGEYYIHYYAQDNVGNIETGHFGPYVKFTQVKSLTPSQQTEVKLGEVIVETHKESKDKAGISISTSPISSNDSAVKIEVSTVNSGSGEEVSTDVIDRGDDLYIEGLEGNTDYIVIVKILDANGNVIGAKEYLVTTPDLVPPVITGVEVASNQLFIDAYDNVALAEQPYSFKIVDSTVAYHPATFYNSMASSSIPFFKSKATIKTEDTASWTKTNTLSNVDKGSSIEIKVRDLAGNMTTKVVNVDEDNLLLKVVNLDSPIYVNVGETINVNKTLNIVGSYSYSLNASTYAQVSENGDLKGVKLGIAVLTVTNKATNMPVSYLVEIEPAKVYNYRRDVIDKEESINIVKKYKYYISKFGFTKNAKWENLDDRVISFDKGVVTGLKQGTSCIRLSEGDNIIEFFILVGKGLTSDVASIQVSLPYVIEKGKTVDLTKFIAVKNIVGNIAKSPYVQIRLRGANQIVQDNNSAILKNIGLNEVIVLDIVKNVAKKEYIQTLGITPTNNSSIVKGKHWVSSIVNSEISKMLLSDYSGKFSPDDYITKDQLLMMFGRYELVLNSDIMAKARVSVKTKELISDKIIDPLVKNMLYKVTEDTVKQALDCPVTPIGNVTRGEFAKLLEDYTEKNLPRPFKHVALKDIFGKKQESSLRYCIETGLIQGNGKGQASSESYLTNAEALMIFNRLYDLSK